MTNWDDLKRQAEYAQGSVIPVDTGVLLKLLSVREAKIRVLGVNEGGLLLIPDTMDFLPGVTEELAEETGMAVICGPEGVLDSVEVSDFLNEVRAEVWDYAHEEMCKLGKFCSAHAPGKLVYPHGREVGVESV